MLPYADTAAMNAHLAKIARTVAPGAHAILVLDGAGWHPLENVWQFLRANWLAISVFDGYDAIIAACCAAWNRFAVEHGFGRGEKPKERKRSRR